MNLLVWGTLKAGKRFHWLIKLTKGKFISFSGAEEIYTISQIGVLLIDLFEIMCGYKRQVHPDGDYDHYVKWNH